MGKGDGYRVVAYRGDTQQGPYEGAFVFTRDKDAIGDAELRARVDASVRQAGLVPEQMVRRHPFPSASAGGPPARLPLPPTPLTPHAQVAIDNSCPDEGNTRAGVSSAEARKEKLEWKDVFELTEWFRPGTLKKDANFDPAKMM